MGQAVPIAIDTWDRGHGIHSPELIGNRAGRIGLQGQHDQVVQQTLLGDGIVLVSDVLGRLLIHLRFGSPHPAFGLLQSALEIAHRGQVLVQLVSVGVTETFSNCVARPPTVSRMLRPRLVPASPRRFPSRCRQ